MFSDRSVFVFKERQCGIPEGCSSTDGSCCVGRDYPTLSALTSFISPVRRDTLLAALQQSAPVEIIQQAAGVALSILYGVQSLRARGNKDGFNGLASDACDLVCSILAIITAGKQLRSRLLHAIVQCVVRSFFIYQTSAFYMDRQLQGIENFVLKKRSLFSRFIKSTSDSNKIAAYRQILKSFELVPVEVTPYFVPIQDSSTN